jgi:hemerythrin
MWVSPRSCSARTPEEAAKRAVLSAMRADRHRDQEANRMALFVWSDDYSVRIPSVDAQHQKLVEMLNALHDGMVAGSGSERLKALLDGLVDYTAKHFAHEEKLFAQYSYPQTKEHAEEHRKLVGQVLEFKGKYEAGQASINMQLMKFLKDWLIKHILGSDKAFGPFLSEAGAK